MTIADERKTEVFNLYNQGFNAQQIFDKVRVPMYCLNNCIAKWDEAKQTKPVSAGTNFVLITNNQEVIEAYYKMIRKK